MRFKSIVILVVGLFLTLCFVFLLDFASDVGGDDSIRVGRDSEVSGQRILDGNSSSPRRTKSDGPTDSPTLLPQTKKLTETWLSVVVRDRKGVPVQDAFVEMVRSENKADLRQPFDYGFTDKNGRLRCRLDIRSTTVIVNRDRASKKYLSSTSKKIHLENKEEQGLEVVLEPCDASLLVLAVTPEGKPIKGVFVQIRGEKSKTRSSGRTNRLGEVLFDHLLPQEFSLWGNSKSSSPKVEHPKRRVVVVHAGSRAAESLVLAAYGRVTVRARLVGKKPGVPLSVHVTFMRVDGPLQKSASCTLEAQGETTVNLPYGDLRAVARCVQGAKAFLAVVETPTFRVGRDDVADCEIAVYASGNVLNGQVVDVDGNPVPGIGIAGYVTSDELKEPKSRIFTMSDSDGIFIFPALPEGQIEVRPETRSYRKLDSSFQYATYGHAASLQKTHKTDVGEIRVVLERGYRVNVRFSKPLRGGESLTLETHPYGRFPMDRAQDSLNFNHLYRGSYGLTMKAKNGEILRQTRVDFGALKNDVYVLDVVL